MNKNNVIKAGARVVYNLLTSPAHSSSGWACECPACAAGREWLKSIYGLDWYDKLSHNRYEIP